MTLAAQLRGRHGWVTLSCDDRTLGEKTATELDGQFGLTLIQERPPEDKVW